MGAGLKVKVEVEVEVEVEVDDSMEWFGDFVAFVGSLIAQGICMDGIEGMDGLLLRVMTGWV